MSKKINTFSRDFEKSIMKKVKSNKIVMRPRWFFLVGSLLMIVGLVGFSIGAVFLTNLTLFSLRRHGPMGEWRLQQIITSFPIWVPILALVGIVFGVWLLKKYDFSYKKNFWAISISFVIAIILAAFIIDQLGLNETWFRRGPMRQFYRQIEGQEGPIIRGYGQGKGQGKGIRYR